MGKRLGRTAGLKLSAVRFCGSGPDPSPSVRRINFKIVLKTQRRLVLRTSPITFGVMKLRLVANCLYNMYAFTYGLLGDHV